MFESIEPSSEGRTHYLSRRALRLWLGGMLAALVALTILRGAGGQRPSPVSNESLRVAVERGVSYVRGNRAHLESTSDLSALIVLDYLQRKYGLPGDLAFEHAYDGSSHADMLRVWGRFVGDDAPVDEGALGSLSGNPGIEELVVHALYCDRFPLSDDYARLLTRFADRGGYDLTHAVLSLELLRENGCASRAGLPPDFEDRLRRAMHALLDRRPPDPRLEELDVRYEATALLEDFLGDRDISDDELGRILGEQQSDGGWKAEADHASRLHPTVLALWALLDRANPNASRAPFVRGGH